MLNRISLPGMILLLAVAFLLSCSDDNVTNEVLPRTPSNPSPANGVTVEGIRVMLSWDCSHPEGKALTYDLYFDTISPPPRQYFGRHYADSIQLGLLQYEKTYYWKVVAVDENYNSTSSPVWSFSTGPYVNLPPGIPSSPFPPDGQTEVSRNTTLHWSCQDPNGEQLTYDVYFGSDSLPPLVSSQQYSTNYNPPMLQENTTYFWKIVARDSSDEETSGPIWHFTTTAITNRPPTIPTSPSPADSRIDVAPYYVTLHWQCQDPDDDPLTYTLWLGPENPPPFFDNLTDNMVDLQDDLLLGTTYYWQVRATDNHGNATDGPVWSFSTWPANITPEGGFEINSDATGIFVQGDYAFVATVGQGLLVLNISNPLSPALAGSYQPGCVLGDVVVEGNYCYLNAGSCGFRILDISNVQNPQLVGSLDLNGTIFVSGNYAYLACFNDGVKIVDISDKAHPAIIGSIITDLAEDIWVSGSFAYVADEHEGLKILNISNPATPILIGQVDTGTLLAISVSGNYAYVADSYSGMQMIDVSSVAAPRLAYTFTVAGGARDIYLDGDYAYMATGSYGIQVADISDTANPHLVGTLLMPPNPKRIFGAANRAYVAYQQSGEPEFRIFRLGP